MRDCRSANWDAVVAVCSEPLSDPPARTSSYSRVSLPTCILSLFLLRGPLPACGRPDDADAASRDCRPTPKVVKRGGAL